jgi:tetratricopeptide (TPR) repeat protein
MLVASSRQVSSTKREYLILPEDEYLKLKNDQIDVAVGSLIIAKGIYPDIDIKKYLNQIDAMVGELEPKLKACKSPYEIVKTINKYLFVDQKLKYDKYRDFINNVLDEKHGHCQSFSCLYLSIAERLQLPFYGVSAPDHIFVRYDDGITRINIETTRRGETITEEQIFESLGVPSPAEISEDNIYLRNLVKRQLLSGSLNSRGCAFERKGETDKAIADYTKAIDLDIRDAEAYYNRGAAFYKNGDVDKAIADWTKAIDLNPKHAYVYNSRGYAFAGKGDFDKAIEDWTKAIELNPRDAEPYYNRGLALSAKHDFDKALLDISSAIAINPQKACFYFSRAKVYFSKGDKTNALQDFTKAIELDSRYKIEIKKMFGRLQEYAEDEEFKKIIE